MNLRGAGSAAFGGGLGWRRFGVGVGSWCGHGLLRPPRAPEPLRGGFFRAAVVLGAALFVFEHLEALFLFAPADVLHRSGGALPRPRAAGARCCSCGFRRRPAAGRRRGRGARPERAPGPVRGAATGAGAGASVPGFTILRRFTSTTTLLVRPWLKVCLTSPASTERFSPSGLRPSVGLLSVSLIRLIISCILQFVATCAAWFAAPPGDAVSAAEMAPRKRIRRPRGVRPAPPTRGSASARWTTLSRPNATDRAARSRGKRSPARPEPSASIPTR